MKFAKPVITAMLATLALSTNAALIQQDLNSAQDKLLTLDTDSQLQWLNVNATRGLTFQQIMNGAGNWLAQGFRPAVKAELDQLFQHARVVTGPPPSQSDFTNVNTLVSYLGCNLCNISSGQNGSSVLYADSELQAQGQLGHAVFYTDVYGRGFATTSASLGLWEDKGVINLTTILVRSTPSVPEPANALLFGFGLLMLIGCRLLKVKV